MKQGKASILFDRPVFVKETASIVGGKEGDGPLGDWFDEIEKDASFGEKNWEDAESTLQKRTAELVLKKAGVSPKEIRYAFAGDLLNQTTASSFGLLTFNIPLFGLYGACSTMGESLALGAMTVAAGYADQVLCITSSHFGGAEKTFRFPLDYGSQRPYSATWTVTGSGAVILGKEGFAKITGVTVGTVVDYGIKDPMNMGAAMAPAAADVIEQALSDFGKKPEDFDKIITGDLGTVGKTALLDLLLSRGIRIEKNHMDCGIEMFDGKRQDTHAGGSGCGCAASVFAGFIANQLKTHQWKKVLFCPTGALMSQTSYHEGKTIPGISHAVMLEDVNVQLQ